MTQVNPEYKDRLFAFIFGREENMDAESVQRSQWFTLH